PEPDSPTTATVSPAFTCISTPRTASTGPSGVSKVTRMSRMSKMRSPMSAILRVERVAQSIAQEVEREEQARQRDGGIEQHVWSAAHVARAFGNKHAEARQRLLHAEAQEGEEAF